MNQYLDIKPNILKAIKENKPVIALESTIISFGMPYPKNVETALNVEKVVSINDGVPATIAIINGRIKVGLSADEITYIASNPEMVKVSKRDLAYVISNNLSGATTVSATILIAEMVGIKFFATGGIGGVHRNASKTFDISRDLEELANSNMCVVSAGAKSILDIGLTLEYLETKGISVIGYNTDYFPAFYTRKSKYKVPIRLDNPKDIANLLNAKYNMNINGSLLVTNPIPKPFSIDEELIETEINNALLELEENQITGKEITPYLLSKVNDLTKGLSLEANIHLVYNNAKLATLIAKHFFNL
ncbi:MAG: pseudouridine-5'-phosphate glycosidase [Acholeplasmataceae bacterium]